MTSVQLAECVFPLVPRWNGLAAVVYGLSWISAAASAWVLAGAALGRWFFRGPDKAAARHAIYHRSAASRPVALWLVLLPLGLAGALSVSAIEPGVWAGTVEPLDGTMLALRGLVLCVGLALMGWVWSDAAVGKRPSPTVRGGAVTGPSGPQAAANTGPSGPQAAANTGSSGVDVGVMAAAIVGAALGLDKILGLGVSPGDVSTGGIAELLMWVTMAPCLAGALLAAGLPAPADRARMARVALGFGALTLFFGVCAAVIRSGAGVAQARMLGLTAVVCVGLVLLLALLMVHLVRLDRVQSPARVARWLGIGMAVSVLAVSWLGRTEIGTSRLTGRGQVFPTAPDPYQIVAEVAIDYDPRELEIGKAIFERSCAQCHGIDYRIVGPPVTEIGPIYKDRPQDMVLWIKNPGKRRADYPPMARIVMTEDRYEAVSKFVVALSRTQEKKLENKSQNAGEK